MQKESSCASTSHDQSRIASDHSDVREYGVTNKESELEYITSKEKKERKNAEILYRTSSSAKLTILSHGNYGDSCNFVSSEFNTQIENGTVNNDLHVHNLNPVIHGSGNKVLSSAGESCAVTTNSDILLEGSNAAQLSVRAKHVDRTRMEFNSRRTEFQSVELDEEKMLDMTGSYSEILGKPLFMTLATEPPSGSSALSAMCGHEGNNDILIQQHLADTEIIKDDASQMPTVSSDVSCKTMVTHKQISLMKMNDMVSQVDIDIKHELESEESQTGSLGKSALPSVLPSNTTIKMIKPSSLPHLKSNIDYKHHNSNGTAGLYCGYYTNTNPDSFDEPDMKTPVYEDMDPAQAILSQHRLAAFLASPDCAPDCITPSLEVAEDSDCHCTDGPDGVAMPSESLTVGRCGPELAEAALQAVGTVTKLPNNTVAFVADDLTEKIRLASPGSAGSGASTPRFGYNHQCYYHHQHHHQYPGSLTTPPHSLFTSTHSLATPPHSVATPPYLYGRPPPLDPTLLNDIERHARRLATNVDGLIESLTDTLHGASFGDGVLQRSVVVLEAVVVPRPFVFWAATQSATRISALTVDCVEAYRDTVCKTCDAVDANIKSMYQLMAKSEELSKSMKPVCALHAQIKDVRRTLDILDAEMHS